jgi:hypothetical protein
MNEDNDHTVFTIGDRIIVTNKYRGAGCNHDMIGYYGHIVRLPFETDDDESPFLSVKLIGRINGQPIHPHRVGHINEFPVYAFEIQHID